MQRADEGAIKGRLKRQSPAKRRAFYFEIAP
jgi:hypothetical protein